MTSRYPCANSLYPRWLEIAEVQPERIALRHLGTGQALTWQALRETAETFPAPPRLRLDLPLAPVVADGVAFFLNTLAAWREGLAILPLEPGAAPPADWLDPAIELPPLPADCAVVKLTSGSTGNPRGIAFTSAQIAADADQIARVMGLNRFIPNLGVISLAHSYGFSNLVTPLLLHGIPLILAESPLPEAMRRALREIAAQHLNCVLPAVPALWKLWLEAAVFAQGAAPVKFGISAGAPLPLDLERRAYEASGLRIHNFYGASECGGIAYDATEFPRRNGEPSLAGRLMVGIQIQPDSTCHIRGKAVGTCYWPTPEPGLRDGLYHCQDLVEVLNDNELHLIGRSGDLINVAGRKVMPMEIENVLKTHPDVTEALVFSIPSRDAARQEEIVACLNTTAPQPELSTLAHQALAGWKIPRHWWLTDDLKPDTRGKLSRDAWRKRFLHAFPELNA